MEFILLLFLLVVAVLGTIMMVKASRQGKQIRKLESRLSALEKLQATNQASAPEKAAEHPVPTPEPVVSTESFSKDGPTPKAPPPLPDFIKPTADFTAREQIKPSPSGEKRKEQRSSAFEKFRANFNLEQFMGVKLFAWLGGLALFLAVSFFIKYSFERDLIPPTMRAALGFVTGFGLLAGGILMRRKDYQVTAQTLCGTGIVILYAVAFACRELYEFPIFTTTITFLCMVAITVIAFVLAVRLNALVVAILGILGGFLTPILLSTGQDHATGLFSYIALLDVGLLAVAYHRRWYFLSLMAAGGTALMQLLWMGQYYAPEKITTALIILLIFPYLFLAACVWFTRTRKGNNWLEFSAFGLSGFTFLITLFMILLTGSKPPELQTFSLIFGTDVCVLGLVVLLPKRQFTEGLSAIATFGLLMTWMIFHLEQELFWWGAGVILFFAALHSAFPMLLGKFSRKERPTSVWSHGIPTAALLLFIVPMLKLQELSNDLWPSILALDLIAFVLALVSGSLFALLGAVVFTLVNAIAWILGGRMNVDDLPMSLMVIGGFTVILAIASLFLLRKGGIASLKSSLGRGLVLPSSMEWIQGGDRHVPALTAGLPFGLLLLMVQTPGLDNPTAIFCLALVLIILLLFMTRIARQPWLPAVALGLSYPVFLLWQAMKFNADISPQIVGWYLGFHLFFLAFPFIACRGKEPSSLPWIAGASSGPLYFFLIHNLAERTWDMSLPGLIPLGFAVVTGVAFTLILKNPQWSTHANHRQSLLAWYGGAGLLFVTLIFPIQFERQWLTIAWGLEGAALLWLFRRVPHPGLQKLGIGLLFSMFVRLALNSAVLTYHPRSETPILNWYLYTYGIASLTFFAAAMFAAPPKNLFKGRDIRPMLYSLGTILAFLLVNIEIADYFTKPGASVLTFKFSGDFARDMSYSIAWSVFAFILLVIGLLKKVSSVRYAGLGLLGATLIKLFFHDLSELAQLYRVGALVGVATIAILASFLYQKFLTGTAQGETGSSEKKP